MNRNLLIILVLTCFISNNVTGQNNRIKTHENIGWYNLLNEAKVPRQGDLVKIPILPRHEIANNLT
jgi:hypothetical protein